MQKLLVLQSLWAMEGIDGGSSDASLESTVARIARAGFDGISAHWTDPAFVRRAADCLSGTDLAVEGMCLPATIDDLKPVLENAAAFPVHHLTIQPDARPRRLADGVALLEGWHRLAEQVDVPVYIETHRGRLTSDLLFTLDLLDAFPRLRLVGDLSHYLVAREMDCPLGEENEAHLHRILDHCYAFHGRVASPGQVQVGISDPHNSRWLDLFMSWWGHGFRSWRRRTGQHESLSFTCELGPAPYAILGQDGTETGDRWAEALRLAELVRDLWRR